MLSILSCSISVAIRIKTLAAQCNTKRVGLKKVLNLTHACRRRLRRWHYIKILTNIIIGLHTIWLGRLLYAT
ncbi:hypothetical protein D3C78_1792040 [compost metagenome]